MEAEDRRSEKEICMEETRTENRNKESSMATSHTKLKAREGQKEGRRPGRAKRKRKCGEHGNSVTKGQRENSMATGHVKQRARKSRKKGERERDQEHSALMEKKDHESKLGKGGAR